jgi:hypothetical protein
VATGPKTSSYVQFHILSSPDGFLDPGQIAGAGADLRTSENGFGLLWGVKDDRSGQLVSGLFRPGAYWSARLWNVERDEQIQVMFCRLI